MHMLLDWKILISYTVYLGVITVLYETAERTVSNNSLFGD